MTFIPRKLDGSEPVIGVLMPMVWSVRNVVYSGVLDRLAGGGASVRLFLRKPSLIGREGPPQAFAAAAGCEPLLCSATGSAKGKALLDGVVRSAFSRRNHISSYDIYRRWFHRDDGPRERLRAAGTELLGALGQAPPLFDTLCRMTELLYRRAHDLTEIRKQLERCAPDLIWSTVCVSPFEYPYILAARDLGVPLVTSILSFDNLTSRGRLPKFDHYLVWNEGMRDQLLRQYPYVRADQATVTGTPQFDFHRRADFHWPRERTLGRLGLPPAARYFLYSTSHESLAPEEPALVERVGAMLRAHGPLADHWIVVRLHPLDDGRRWTDIADVRSRIVLSQAWDSLPEADGSSLSSPEDQARLVSTIAHADACINVASTMSLDAAILDRPVINIDFAAELDSPRGLLYAEYDADHYRPLVESGGIRLARSWRELASLLERAVSDPALDRRERAEMVRRECGVVDGESAARVADTLLGLLGGVITSSAGRADAAPGSVTVRRAPSFAPIEGAA